MVDQPWGLHGVDIFRDLPGTEVAMIASAVLVRPFSAGELLHTPHSPVEVLYILTRGRVRLFRVSADGRALTIGIVSPGTIFGELALLGQGRYDSFAQALDEVVVCVLDKADVRRLLLADARIAARITEILGQRLLAMERRLSDAVFKNVPQRVASTLDALVHERRGPVVMLTHEQLAALVGTSRENATKALGELAERGLIRLGRGRILVLDTAALSAEAGAESAGRSGRARTRPAKQDPHEQ